MHFNEKIWLVCLPLACIAVVAVFTATVIPWYLTALIGMMLYGTLLGLNSLVQLSYARSK